MSFAFDMADYHIFTEKLGITTLSEIAGFSFEQVCEAAAGTLSMGECRAVFDAAVAQQSLENTQVRRILAKANPQFRSAVTLNIPAAEMQFYSNDFIPERNESFVREGDVASMFSPAAYLTELYREARYLHDPNSFHHLDKRRPDLGELVLSQQNMEEVVSTLSLSNDILMAGIKKKFSLKTDAEVYQKLVHHLYNNPHGSYHAAYDVIRQVLVAKKVSLPTLLSPDNRPDQADRVLPVAMELGISPGNYALLSQSGIQNNADVLYKRMFGDVAPESLLNAQALAGHYGLPAAMFKNILTVLEPEVSDTGGQYIDDVLTYVDSIKPLRFTRITRVNKTNPGARSLNPEIRVTSEGALQLSFIWSTNAGNFNVKVNGESVWNSYDTGKDRYQSHTVNLNSSLLTVDSLKVTVFESDVDQGYSHIFTIERYSSRNALLYLNSLVLLHRATQLSLPTVFQVFERHSKTLNEAMLNSLDRVKRYVTRYNIKEEQALVLANFDISQRVVDGKASQFDVLFNTPPLDGKHYVLGGDKIDTNPGKGHSNHNKSILKRAFKVDDVGFNKLLYVVDPIDTDGCFANNIGNISDMYCAALLAKVHQFSVAELDVLRKTLGYSKTAIYDVSDDALATLVDNVYQTVTWLRKHNLSMVDLMLMTTSTYDTAQIPEIENLVSTLVTGVQEATLTEDKLKAAMAPHLASVLGLSSSEVAHNLLIWLDSLAKGSVDSMWGMIQNLDTGKPFTIDAKVITFCHRLAQLSLIYQRLQLSERELALIVAKPVLLQKGMTVVNNDVLSLMTLSHFHQWIIKLGAQASSVLMSLLKETLTVEQVAQAMAADTKAMQLAAEQVNSSLKASPLLDMTTVERVLQWHEAAQTLGISPQEIAQLYRLSYATSIKQDGALIEGTLYEDWQKLATALVARLKETQRLVVMKIYDERLSTALCEFYLNHVVAKNFNLRTRDELYSYLLIDNQVNAEVKTSRVAEAMASIQLYVNRCLQQSSREGSIKTAALSRSFIKEWEIYNRRYSTWAGVSQLTYFPENYVNPTQRIGQTKMMDTLLQSINQSQLSTDTVEDAFKAYLTEFEQVANLSIVSAYHDALNLDSGLTYFVGKNQDATPAYYWRSVDHDQFKEGVFPATAWKEWKEITCAVTPIADLIRPVMFNTRLHLMWLERREDAKLQQVKEKQEEQKPAWVYELKLAYLRYDGTWSAPLSFEVNLKSGLPKEAGLYCTVSRGSNGSLQVMVYEKLGRANEYTVSHVHYSCAIDGGFQLVSAMATDALVRAVRHELDTIGAPRVANHFASGQYEFTSDTVKFTDKYTDKKITLVGQSITKNTETNKYIFKGQLRDVAAMAPSKSLLSLPSGMRLEFTLRQVLQHAMNRKISNIYLLQAVKDSNYLTLGWFLGKGNEGEFFYAKDQSFPSVRLFIDGYARTTLNETTGNIPGFSNMLGNIWAGVSLESVSAIKAFSPITLRETRAFPLILIAGGGIDQGEAGRTTIEVNPGQTTYDVEFNVDLKSLEEKERQNLSFDLLCADFPDLLLAEIITRLVITTKKSDESNVMQLVTNKAGAQYMMWGKGGEFKTRLNTLFARELMRRANRGLDTILSLETQRILEPALGINDDNRLDQEMDFAGANALYFWELFYYTPMLVAQRLMQEQNFDQAARWLSYIFNPSSIDPNDKLWKVRPLLEDTRWNDTPLDSTNPDAVAQADPMHYKAATFMRLLELLLARGDSAYRQLERDTLTEAKMWYMQALTLMGKEPVSAAISWQAPALKGAAEQSATLYSANSLTRIFYPQQNGRWESLRQTFQQRLYNLRHNLTLDGQLLSLPLFAEPADPAALLSAATASSQGGVALPTADTLSLRRFPVVLEGARGMVSQLSQLGSTLSGVIERQDAEQMAVLMQTQGKELLAQSVDMQQKNLDELAEETKVLTASLAGAAQRHAHYSALYDEDVNVGEQAAMGLRIASGMTQTAANALYTAAAVANMVPNIYGMAVGGSQYGALPTAIALGLQTASAATSATADAVSQSEMYRRRREEWQMMRDSAKVEMTQIEAQQAALKIRKEAASMQLTYLTTQQKHHLAQWELLQRKFSNQALYNWMRGRLSALYFQFYDLAVSRCLLTQLAFKWETKNKTRFIKPGAWQGTYAGLLCGEALMLNLAAMESAYLAWESRALEVERTVSLAQVYQSLGEKANFTLSNQIETLLKNNQDASVGNEGNQLKLAGNTLSATLTIKDLQLKDDYPVDMQLGDVRRIKQISVSLPALLGPYQDVQATLSYAGATSLAKGCTAIAVSRGMDDSGQFQLDFNDGKYLPFEGIAIDDAGKLVLHFPNAKGKQESLLKSLSDIILHIRYTIRD
ncbi:neuraminidase-like domain-containing protein [Photorhabdus temperata]|uniref:Toxin n=1 Tax=Photorhabdus temperata J3 TaxID=1389415 RepID=U7R2A1_PHOTE|nr:neuraminidase-like domain-containing protein [Photorhabdus temperata]ERT13745.1 hypothetical protein O185_07290 [Photorhabdus temperata J3]